MRTIQVVSKKLRGGVKMKGLINLWIKQQGIKDGLKERVRGVLRNEKGQGMVEYGLILALVAIVVIVALGAMGGTISDKFNQINGKLTGVPAPE